MCRRGLLNSCTACTGTAAVSLRKSTERTSVLDIPASTCPTPVPIRLQENDRGDEKIRQLIDTLDARKDEAIERTFKGVAKQFRDIFAQVGAPARTRVRRSAAKPTSAHGRCIGWRVRLLRPGLVWCLDEAALRLHAGSRFRRELCCPADRHPHRWSLLPLGAPPVAGAWRARRARHAEAAGRRGWSGGRK